MGGTESRRTPGSNTWMMPESRPRVLAISLTRSQKGSREDPIGFQVLVQVANDKDIVDDATVHWPEERPFVNLGRILLTNVVLDAATEHDRIIFDPIPRVEGIEPSEDPLLELRAAIYLLSGRRRRQAHGA